jgi:hypothetical protein
MKFNRNFWRFRYVKNAVFTKVTALKYLMNGVYNKIVSRTCLMKV